MQDDNYSTQAVWGSPLPTSNSPLNRWSSPSPPSGEAGPSNPPLASPHPGQHAYPAVPHPGTDSLLYDSWRDDSADDFNYEEQPHKSQSPHMHSRSQSDPYGTSNPDYQPPPTVPTPPNDYGFPAANDGHEYQHHQHAKPLHTSNSIHRYTRDQEAWSPAAQISAEQRKELLAEDIPDLKREREYDDKMEEELAKLTEDEKRRKRARREKRRESSPKNRHGQRRDRDFGQDRRGGGQGSWHEVQSS
ncbi:hypothetical protein ONS96_011033 [Cadophora gregata f. sp. sojae]|nr:hypothetical protein ONS96_011033 [Cadophora gregata f. sp. sojae]